MKRLKTILLFLVICISCFGQEENDTISSLFDNFVYSRAFRAKNLDIVDIRETKSIISIAIDKDRQYYFVIYLIDKDKDDYWSLVNSEEPSHLYLKTTENEIVDLVIDSNKFINQFPSGFNVGGIWTPTRHYITELKYRIPDINKFLSNYYIKCRVWNGISDIDIHDFELNDDDLKNAVKEVTSKYEVTKKYIGKTLVSPLNDF